MVTASPPAAADAASNGGRINSPLSQRRSLPSPWASIVRGDSEQNSLPTAAAASGAPGSSSPAVEQPSPLENSLVESLGSDPQPESSEINGDANAGTQGRPAWNRPGIVEAASVIGGTASWPALSETTRPIQRSSSDISRSVSDGSAPSAQAPIISQSPQRPANNNVHGNSTGNNSMHGRQRSRNRGGGGGSSGTGSSQNTFNQPPLPMPPPFPIFEIPYGMIPAVVDNSIRDPRPIGGVAASQSHTGNDHSSQRSNSSSSRRGGYGPRPRGDGRYHNIQGGRRDQDRRDAHHPPQYVPPPMGYMPPPLPPGAGPFMAPPHMRVFPGQMGFDMASSFYYVPSLQPETFRPIVPPLAPMIFPSANENPLTSMIVKQIDFYFSDDNLVKDSFLRSKMDDHGWVPIGLIASFRRVQQLTKDVPLILECLRHSTIVEVQGDKVRRRNEWNKWLLSSGSVNSDFGARSPRSAPENILAASFREVSVDDSTTNADGKIDATKGHMVMAAGQLPEESTAQLVLANREDSAGVHPIS